MRQNTGLVFIVVGLSLLAVFSFWRIRQTRILSFFNKNNVNLAVQSHSGYKPVRIIISAKNVDLEVKEAQIVKGVWQIHETSAGHLDSSANPGQGGNIVIYGHNKTQVFGPIRWLEKGETVELIDEQGTKFTYLVVEIAEVDPDNLNYVLPKDSETLTLYTCSGLFDSKRYIVVAKPAS